MATAAQIASNYANSRLSTGPTSEIGKAKSSLNAVTTALTGRTVLLPSEDAAEYQRHILAYEKEFSPVGQCERDLVQSIADTVWRLQRIPGLEMAIYAQGHLRFAEELSDYDEALRPGLIELQTFLAYEKQLRNLQLQESRLVRRREKELAELRQLQQQRQLRQTEQMAEAANLYLAARHDGKTFDPAEFGFEFSNRDIERHLERAQAQTARAALKQPAGHAPCNHTAGKHAA
jgi:hypothetical protein